MPADKGSKGLTRRDFAKLAGASGAMTFGVALLDPMSSRQSKLDHAKQVYRDRVLQTYVSARPKVLLNEFHEAESRDLMRRYVVGFTSLVLQAQAGDGNSRRKLLEDVKNLADDKYKTVELDRHRIKAFPACAAAHILSVKMWNHDLLYAGDLISEAMSAPQREIQEIVGQTLISALTRDEFAWRNFWIPDKTLSEFREYLSKRKNNPLLNTGCNVIIQFLLYYDLSLSMKEEEDVSRNSIARQRTIIENIFLEIESARDEFSWFVQGWYGILKDCSNAFRSKSGPGFYNYLPPQTTELLMGWRYFSDPQNQWFRVLSAAALNNGLMVHLNSRIVDGNAPSEWLQEDYGPREAAVAYTKGQNWFRNLALHERIFAESINMAREPLKSTLIQLAKNTASADMAADELDPIYSLIPFRNTISPIQPRPQRPTQNYFLRLRDALAGASISTATALLVDLALRYWKPIADRTPDSVEAVTRPTRGSLEKSFETQEFSNSLEAFNRYMEGDAEALLEAENHDTSGLE